MKPTPAWISGIVVALMVFAAGAAEPQVAASSSSGLKNDQPVEVSSDVLDVFQEEHKAIFSGNVIAVQGTTTMRAAKMIVFYRENDKSEKGENSDKNDKGEKGDKKEKIEAPANTKPEGIYRIEAEGSVVFTTPTETALGDTAIYNVDIETITLSGGNVTLTRGQNVLKGTQVVYNFATGRSTLTSSETQSGRVRGLFMPEGTKTNTPQQPAPAPVSAPRGATKK